MRNDLTNKTFIGINNKEIIVLTGYENESIVFVEKDDPDTHLWFCCDARIENSKLYASYTVNYTVSKNEFFSEINGANPINSLKNKYYQIPKEFLNLICDLYENEK